MRWKEHTCRAIDKPLAVSRAIGFCVLGLQFLLLAGCGTHDTRHSTGGPLPAFAGIPPLAYLVEQIGGKYVKIDVLVQPGQDPHTFEPTPQQVLALSNAAIFFKIGMPFETVLLEKATEGNPRLQVADTTRGIKKRRMDCPCCGHSGGDHAHTAGEGEPDPHVWLSPPLLKIQAENIAQALCRIDPPHARQYRQNLAPLLKRLDAVHQRNMRLLAPYRGRTFFVFHPGFAYFADAYGLKQEAVENGGRSPAAKQLRALIEEARSDGVTTIFVQQQYDPQSAKVLAEAIGGKVVPINGLRADVIADIEDIATKIAAALSEERQRSKVQGQR
jgi:zinc transport system substrate-binding protein